MAGVSHGVAELPDFANQLLRNHEALLEAVSAFAREASPELLVAMIANMPADVHRMQHEVNPGTMPQEADGPGEAASICIEQGLDVGASESKYCRYATGFYLGYGAFLAVELASGAKALVKGVRKASDLADKIRGATDKLESLKGAIRSGDRGPKTALTPEIRTDGGADDVGLSARLESGARAARALKARNEIDDGVFERLTASQRAELLGYVSKYSGGKGVVRTLGPSKTEYLFEIDHNRISNVNFRVNMLKHGMRVGPNRIDYYLDDIQTIQSFDDVDAYHLLKDAAKKGASPSHVWGQYGEARSAVRYLEDGKNVDIEPGNGDYDLSVSNGDELVEVKTRDPGESVTFNWAESQLSAMNKKYDNALHDPEVDVANSKKVLELRPTSSGDSLDAVEQKVTTALDTKNTVKADEVRIVSQDQPTRTIKIGSS